MKNVAATSGHSVSLAILFLAVGIAREGSWAGTDMLLNFYSRPPGAALPLDRLAAFTTRRVAAPQIQSEFAFEEYNLHRCTQQKNAFQRIFFAALAPFSPPVSPSSLPRIYFSVIHSAVRLHSFHSWSLPS